MKKDIRKLTLSELQNELQSFNIPKFRASQIFEWIFKTRVSAFSEMSNLPKDLRCILDEKYFISHTKIGTTQISKDGTIKCSFILHDGFQVEGVLIPTESRTTACVSSQVGCSLDCKFCATGYLKRERNLEAAEILDQVLLLEKLSLEHYHKELSNVVYMGMGEPLLNYSNVMQSIDLLTHSKLRNMSAQRITLSTAGIAKMIKKLADDNCKTNLALSLHNATDSKRSEIMPINESNNLEMLAEALGYWFNKTKIRPTLEYTVIEGVNDTTEDAFSLIKFAKKFPSKVNLIEYNPISQNSYMPTSGNNLIQFASILEKHNLVVNVRRSRGKDIDAACGQLVNKEFKT